MRSKTITKACAERSATKACRVQDALATALRGQWFSCKAHHNLPAHLFKSVLAVYTFLWEPLPPQIAGSLSCNEGDVQLFVARLAAATPMPSTMTRLGPVQNQALADEAFQPYGNREGLC